MTWRNDFNSLKELNNSLWPPGHKNDGVSLAVSRELTGEEYDRLTAILDEGGVVVEMLW